MRTFGASAPLKDLQRSSASRPGRWWRPRRRSSERLAMKIAVGRDHAGFPLKEELRGPAAQGPRSGGRGGVLGRALPTIRTSPRRWARRCIEGTAERGILMCGSGVGASVAANKLPGIRAGVCHDMYSAHQGVEHDDMNVLCSAGVSSARSWPGSWCGPSSGAQFSDERAARCAVSTRSRPSRSATGRSRRRTERHAQSLPWPTRWPELPVGQSVWLDYIRRSLITSGELRRLIDGGRPPGRDARIPPSSRRPSRAATDYDAALDGARGTARRSTPRRSTRRLAIQDIQAAADVLRPVYDATTAPGRLREPRGLPRPRPRHGGHPRRGPAALGGGRPRQRHDQGAGDARGHPRDPPAASPRASTST